MSNYIIDANTYLPQFLQESELMLSIVDCLNVIITEKEDDFKKIHEAYFDMIYKTKNYSLLSYDAKIDIVKELGFDYLLEISTLTSDQLTQLLIFFNLVYMLKGKEEGMRLFLDTLGMVYTYVTWDTMEPKGQPFTANLTIVGNDYANPQIFKKIRNFIRSYMLPWVNITVELTIQAPDSYVYPTVGLLTRLKYTTQYNVIRDVLAIALYDYEVGYDKSVYGAEINSQPGQYIPSYTFPQSSLTIQATPTSSKVVINDEETTIKEVTQGELINYEVSYTPVPQDINYEINGRTITIKAGSTYTYCNGIQDNEPIYGQEITDKDYSTTLDNFIGERILFISKSQNTLQYPMLDDTLFIQNTSPKVKYTWSSWYDTKNNLLKTTEDNGQTWNVNNDDNSIPIFKVVSLEDGTLNVIPIALPSYIKRKGSIVLHNDKTIEVTLKRDKPNFK